ncbi:MAG TPA: DUF4129 domain-containing protein [Gaiellaceae bacterium]|jgi:hypothetical protein
MQPFPQGHGRSLRLASVLLALLVLLAVVAFASRTGFGHASNATPTPGYVNWATSVVLVLFFAMTPVAIWAYLRQTRERLETAKHRSYQARVIRGLAFVFILILVWPIRLYLVHHVHLSQGLHNLFFGNRRVAGHHKPGSGADSYSPTFQWPVLWAALALLLAAVAGWIWWRRTHPALPFRATTPTMESDVAESIDDAIDDLESEPDARLAVIAAYARMERVFGRHGLRRQASETATEYLRRILLGLTTRVDAVGRLTGLFEQAKFSDHPIDGRMKQDAIDALRVIRDDLQVAEA